MFFIFFTGPARILRTCAGCKDLKHDNPIFEPARRHGPAEQILENQKCAEMLAAGLIEPSFSTKYASNLTFPPKKAADGKWTEKRMCNDVRALNEAIITDHYHAAVIEEQLEACLGSTCFTVIDCRSGYNQCKILPSDKEKPHFGGAARGTSTHGWSWA